MEEFFGALLDLGGQNGRWRSPWAISGLLLGFGLGAYLGWTSGGLVAAAGWGLAGAVLGWLAVILFKGFLRFLVLFLVIGVVVVAWYWLTGRL